jgi:ubiquinone/menaquinone biosynthesis C-methylase UbiE
VQVMNTREMYNQWAGQYDTNDNKTRDIEAFALRSALSGFSFDNCLEIGCGTGKNTPWLISKVTHITAIDLSEEMLAKAKEKINSDKVEFIQADITKEWSFLSKKYDLITFSLVLEHIEHLEPVFQKAAKVLNENGCVYIGELHPFKQYTGSKARFETEEGLQIVSCYKHHVSDFMQAAKQNGLIIEEVKEYFDNNDHSTIPRILVLIFRK